MVRRGIQRLDQRNVDMYAGAAAGFAFDAIAAAEAFDAFLHTANAEARRLAGIDSAAVVAHRQCEPGLAVDMAEIDADMLGLRMADGVGQAFLDAAIDGEVDRIAVAALKFASRERERNLRMLARALAHELAQHLFERDVTERHRPQAVEHAAIDGLQMLDDGQDVAQARGDGFPGLPRQVAGCAGNRRRIGFQPEQTRTYLIMQFERSAAALVVLRRDQPAIEPLVFRAHRLERESERIEVIGDGGQLAGMRLRQAHVIGLVLEVGEAGGEHGERIEHTAEQKIKQADHGDIERDGYDPHRDRVVPDLGDLVGGLADDFDLTDAAAADDHRHVERLDRRVDQSCEPSRRRRALVRESTVGPCRQRRGGNSSVRRILHRDPHMAHRP